MNYSIDLADYGYNGECTPDVARVSAVHKERYGLITPFGMTYGFLKPGSYMLGDQPYPTAGDFVRIEFNPSGDSRIIETLPRRSLFSRMEAGPLMREQAVAANFDYVLLVTSLNHDFNPRRMERYLTVAFNSGASPVIVLTKADLCPDYQSKIAEMEITAPGVPVHAVSVYTGLGMDALGQYARPRATLVLLGSSGVGKSSLLNALAGGSEDARKLHARRGFVQGAAHHHPPPADHVGQRRDGDRHARYARAGHVVRGRRAGRGVPGCGGGACARLQVFQLPPRKRAGLCGARGAGKWRA